MIAYAIEDELLPGFLHAKAKVFSVAYLVVLVVCNDLLSLSGADACSKCCGCVRSRVIRCHVHPCRIGDNHLVLLLWDDTCKVAVALALVEVV